MANQMRVRIQASDELLLVKTPDASLLDPGHWGLPEMACTDTSVAPHPAYCGLPTELSAALSNLLEHWGSGPEHIVESRFHIEQSSPDWHPQAQTVHLVDVVLKQKIEPASRRTTTPPAHAWRPANQWIRAFESGDLLLNPLSRHLLWAPADAPPDWAASPYEEPVQGLKVYPVASHTLPPATHTNAFLLGESPRLLVDPSPADETAYARLCDRLSGNKPQAIFLSHHHPDHHQQATRLARDWQLPILCSADTRARIPRRFGQDYWLGLELRTVQDGDVLTHWNGVPVKAHAVPGHDAGHLALAPVNRAWMIVGDLIQGVGTVVIAKPEGNMADYFETLRWVIDFQPKVILPSHGQAMGGTFRIEQTLRHRQLREAQILALHAQGQDMETMLASLYADIDRRLWGLARHNIETHLDKLRAEGRLGTDVQTRL